MGLASALIVLVGAAAGAVLGGWLARVARRRATPPASGIELEAERLRAMAESERQTLLRDADISAREEGLAARAAAEPEFRTLEAGLAERETALAARSVRITEQARALDDLRSRLRDREGPLAEREGEIRKLRSEVQAIEEGRLAELVRVAKQSAEEVQRALVDAELEEARSAAAQTLRQVAEGAVSAEQTRAAKRIMGIAIGRFSGHYLSERYLSIIPLENRGRLVTVKEDDLRALEGVAGIQLALSETQDSVRIEGLDGIGREIARRTLNRMLRRGTNGPEAVSRLARSVAAEVDRETLDFGRRAFSALAIERAHPDLVKLVGRLNFRTSYAQNQWKHSVEAAFLCGMMAAELGLDRKIARRAALLHDIGKALTHELDGSHAVIGAEHARRLGEREVVANAIGAHHTDEPFNGAYAYLVAAADALSGGRPGARRQSEDNHMAKLAEIERITRGFRGVGEAFAVQGGREVRVYVQEDRIDDGGAIRLSSEIAGAISREMTFPGQIKVTVIREFVAVETAS